MAFLFEINILEQLEMVLNGPRSFVDSSRKPRILGQHASSKLDIYLDSSWACLSIITLESISPAKMVHKDSCEKTVNEKKFLSSPSLTSILTKKSGSRMVL